MTYEINETHDPNLKSWVQSANDPKTDFPIQNLPFCIFSSHALREKTLGVAIGDSVVDIEYLIQEVFDEDYFDDKTSPWSLAKISPERMSALRRELINLLRSDASEGAKEDVRTAMYPMSDVCFWLPYAIGDYTELYASVFHATHVGTM